MKPSTLLGKALKKARVDLDVTQKEMAESLGVTASYLSNVELGGRSISFYFFNRIKNYFFDRGVILPYLKELVDVSNGKVSLKGLTEEHALLVCILARLENPSAELLTSLEELLKSKK